jgi:hypothetical protein
MSILGLKKSDFSEVALQITDQSFVDTLNGTLLSVPKTETPPQ